MYTVSIILLTLGNLNNIFIWSSFFILCYISLNSNYEFKLSIISLSFIISSLLSFCNNAMTDLKFSIVFLLSHLFLIKIYNRSALINIHYLKIYFVIIFLFDVYSLYDYNNSIVIRNYINQKDPILDYSGLNFYDVRYAGLFTNPNYCAQVSVILFSLFFKSLKNNYEILIYSCMFLLIMLLSGSRSGFISMIFLLYLIYGKNLIYPLVIFLFYFVSVDYSPFRFLNFYDFFNAGDHSVNYRLNVLLYYISSNISIDGISIILFGKSHISDPLFYFDSDFGNFLHMFGVIGLFLFIVIVCILFTNIKLFYLIFSLLPFMLAGSIFSDIKLNIVMFLIYTGFLNNNHEINR